MVRMRNIGRAWLNGNSRVGNMQQSRDASATLGIADKGPVRLRLCNTSRKVRVMIMRAATGILPAMMRQLYDCIAP